MDETTSCMRCGKELPRRRLKEVVHEEGRTRVRQMVCPNCLDQIMNESSRVRGVVGTEKAAAAHIDRGPGNTRAWGNAARSSCLRLVVRATPLGNGGQHALVAAASQESRLWPCGSA